MTPYYDDGQCVIYHGDCLAILPMLPRVDAVVSDPPYGTGGWRRLDAGAGSDPSGSLVQESWDAGDVEWLALVPADVVLTFWPPARTSLLLNAAIACGLTKHRGLYWRKPDPKPLPGGRTRWSVEPIWVLSREGFVLHGGDDCYEYSALHARRSAEYMGHPYQKPERVMRWLLAKTGATAVLDPFMGIGSTLRAAADLGMRAIGIEREERYCAIAAKRLAQQVLPLEVG